MTITLEIPQELERKLSSEAVALGISVSEYVLCILSLEQHMSAYPKSGAELVAYWENAGVIGMRPDIADSRKHARKIRKSLA